MHLKTILVVAVVTGCGLFSPFAFAAEADSDAALFGKGAHSFFAGNYQKAYTQLNQAVEAKTVDPRVYYFRGLAAHRLNRADAAKADFKKGAQLEVSETNYFCDIDKTLRRVQGNERLLIEQARAAARVEHKKVVNKRAARRYEATRSQESRVLRHNFPLHKAAEFKQTGILRKTPKPVEPQPVKPQPVKPEPTPVRGNIRADRLFKALFNSLGRAVEGQVPRMGAPGMGLPGMPAEGPRPGFRPNVPASQGGSPFRDVPSPQEDPGENPFKNTSYQPKPAVEFANSEGIVHNMPKPGTLVVTFPMQPDPPRGVAVDPAPSFNMLDPVPEKEPVPVEEKAVLAQVEPNVEEVVSKPVEVDLKAKEEVAEKPVELAAEPVIPEPTVPEPVTPEPVIPEPTVPEPSIPEPEMLAASTPKVEIEEPVIKTEPKVEEEPAIEEPPVVPETVAKVEEPKPVIEEPKQIVEEPKQELAMETKLVEEPVEPEPAPETVAKLDDTHAKSTALVEESLVRPEAPIEMPKSVEPPKSAAELVAKKTPIEKPVELVEKPIKTSPKSDRVKTSVVDPVSVAKKPVKTPASEVSQTASAEKPAEKPDTPKPNKRRITLPSGASVIPTLDLNNLPPEDDPFA